MTDYDVFNGDADGLCGLLQLRLAEPRQTRLVTGVKRDIQLLQRVAAGAGDRVTALDISLDKNRSPLVAMLKAGAEVFYCDHHFAGDIPQSDKLTTLINPAPEVCTSLLINRHLKGQFAPWALVGAFGDNLRRSAHELARQVGYDEDLEVLERLGICINYNAYGASEEDLHCKPADLYQRLAPYPTPADFLAAESRLVEFLDSAYSDDLTRAAGARVVHQSPGSAVLMLPDAAWARRVSGVYSNRLANDNPARAHAVITERADGTCLVSVRAPLENRTGADEVCRQFDTGGGRKAAAGINSLGAAELDRFIDVFSRRYPEPR